MSLSEQDLGEITKRPNKFRIAKNSFLGDKIYQEDLVPETNNEKFVFFTVKVQYLIQ